MGNQISQQLTTFGQSILLGVAAAVLYDLLRPFRLRLTRFTALLDGAYCLAVGAAAFLFLLRRGEGELRAFIILGAIGGAVVFFCTFSQSYGRCGAFGRIPWRNWSACWPPRGGGSKIFVKKWPAAEKISFILPGDAIQ